MEFCQFLSLFCENCNYILILSVFPFIFVRNVKISSLFLSVLTLDILSISLSATFGRLIAFAI